MTKFQIFQDKSGEYRWRLRAANGQIVATSGEGYKAKADAQHGLELVKQLAATATVDDTCAATTGATCCCSTRPATTHAA